MYIIRTPNYRKLDPVMRWALPARVFAACGACHILAHPFLERQGAEGQRVMWSKPDAGFTGNHIVVDGEGWTFDYHSYARQERLADHHFRRARQSRPGWDGTLVEIPAPILLSESRSRAFDPGLWLREPGQFLRDALPRARRYLDRFPVPPA